MSKALKRRAAMGEQNWGSSRKFRIDDAEFAILCGGPYDGLKLSMLGKERGPDRQIGLPTPQFIKEFRDIPSRESDSSSAAEYEFVEFCAKDYSFTGDEIIAVYISTPIKKKYCEVFDDVPDKLKKLSSVLNVSIFKFDFYAKFSDIDAVIE